MSANHDIPRALKTRLDAIESMQEGLQILDRDLRYIYLNSAAATHGQRTLDELLGKRMADMYPGVEHTEMYAILQSCLADGVPRQLENLFVYPDGGQRWFELRVEPVREGILILSIDIHHRKQLEERLQHAQRMQAVGRLASGIAHDFNNLLTIIGGHASFLDSELQADSEAHDDVQRIQQAARQGAKLTQQLLQIGQARRAPPESVDVEQAVIDATPMIHAMLGPTIDLQVNITSAGIIRIGAGQLNQVLLNLTANAVDAMPEGGRFTIDVATIELDHSSADPDIDLTPGPYVYLRVSDTGSGMDANTRSRVFEPFFTTKAPDRGTGLGLATAHGIISESGGRVDVQSELGQGTTFKLYFPLATVNLVPRSVADAPTLLHGTETVLVVDNDADVLNTCVRVLERYGYTVVTASDWQAASGRLDTRHGPVSAALADITSPTESEAEAIAQLRATHPDLRILSTAGYVDHDRTDADHVAWIERPFTATELAGAVRGLLDR